MGSIRVAIVGVGNCASSLIQGVEYYKDADPSGFVPGLMHVQFGDYHVRDVEFVAVGQAATGCASARRGARDADHHHPLGRVRHAWRAARGPGPAADRAVAGAGCVPGGPGHPRHRAAGQHDGLLRVRAPGGGERLRGHRPWCRRPDDARGQRIVSEWLGDDPAAVLGAAPIPALVRGDGLSGGKVLFT